jgi:probable HAF family extracellular repeat protein
MKSIVSSIAASSLLAALAMAQPPRYTITDLGAVGGAPGQPFFLTNSGLVSGATNAPDGTEHAVIWYQGLKASIGTPGLGGPNSVAFANNERSQVVGEAETSIKDPNGEDFCGFKAMGLPSSGNRCLPFLWQNGVMTALPTLGGNNGFANMINNRGEVAGSAENTAPDSTCAAPQIFQFKPAVWDQGAIKELSTYAGDPDGIAYAINDNGQVVGGSGDCAPFSPISLVNLFPFHALLWQTGTMTDLGSLGGTGHGNGIVAVDLNNKGQVVGNSDLPGDTNFHAFLWTETTGMQDLGTLPWDVNSAAISINDAGEMVGLSLDAKFNPRAFFWQNGVMTDLNALIPGGSPLFLLTGCSINSRGEIIGIAVEKSTGDVHGYLGPRATVQPLARAFRLPHKV